LEDDFDWFFTIMMILLFPGGGEVSFVVRSSMIGHTLGCLPGLMITKKKSMMLDPTAGLSTFGRALFRGGRGATKLLCSTGVNRCAA